MLLEVCRATLTHSPTAHHFLPPPLNLSFPFICCNFLVLGTRTRRAGAGAVRCAAIRDGDVSVCALRCGRLGGLGRGVRRCPTTPRT